MSTPRTLFGLALLALPAAAQSWEVQPLVLEGDSVPGVGLVTSIQNLAVNNGLDWRVEADTDQADTNKDYVLLSPAGVVAQEGQPLSAPAGALLDSFDSLTLDASGNSAVNYFLDGTSGFSDDSGIYWNGNLLIQEGDLSGAVGFSPNTPYIGFFETKLADNGDILVMATVDDPAVSSSADRALVRLTTDLLGNLASETLILKESDLLPGTTGLISDFGTGPQQFDMNDAGSILFYADTDLPLGTDGFIVWDNTILAQEGGTSPIVGRPWSSLSSPEVALNNSGDVAFSGSLQGDSASNLLLVKNTAKFRQEGDPVPGMPGFKFTSFGSGPLDLADNGDLLWYGDWDDPNTSVDTGLFVNDQLVVQEGVTTVGGIAIDTLRGIQDGYFISDDGRFIIFEAVLADSTEGAFLATLKGDVVNIPGCFSDGSSITHFAGNPNIGETLWLTFGSTEPSSGLRYLAISGTALTDSTGCGLLLPGLGEFLISFLPPDPYVLPMGVYTGTNANLPLPIPNDPAYIGLTLYLQGFYLYTGASPNKVDLTNALKVTFGA